MIEKQSDAVSPKVADVLEKVMSQAAEGRTGRLQESPSPRLVPTTQQQQLPPSTFLLPSSPPPSSERLASARESRSPDPNPISDMVTSAQAQDKDAGDSLHYFRSDRHDSLSSSDGEFGYDDEDDVFLNRRQTSDLASSSNNIGNSGIRNNLPMPPHHAYFNKRANEDVSDGEKDDAVSKETRIQEQYALHCSQTFPEGSSSFGPFSPLHPDFPRVGLFGARGSSEGLYSFGQPRVAPLLCGQPLLKKENSPSSPRPADSNHGNNSSSMSSPTDNGLYNVRYTPSTYKRDVPGHGGSSVSGFGGSAQDPLQAPGMKFPLTPSQMGPFPLPAGFGAAGGAMIMSPPSGLQQGAFLTQMGPGMQPIMTNSSGHLYFCHICEYSGPTKEEFDQHMVVHFGYRCPHCDYTSRTEGRLKRHIKDFHTDSENKQRAVPGRPKVYRCKQCDFSCTNKVEFWEHARTHIKEDKLLQCPNCPFVTEYRHHLEYHLRNHFGSKPYKCGKCNYSCVNRSMLNSHMKSHTNVYQYRCADCTYATKYCHSLKLHLRKHRHQPAAVLNSDGSLPQGIDAKMSGLTLMAKRGPPRGPRGLRKEKDSSNGDPEPLMSGLFPMRHPLHPAEALSGMEPMINGALMAAARYWPLVPNSIHPPPPLIPIVGGPHAHSGLPGMAGLDARPNPNSRVLERNPQAERDGNIAEEFKCSLCSFVSEAEEQLEYHVMKAHDVKASDLLGRQPANASDEQAMKLQARRMSAPPPSSHPPTSTSLAVQADTMYRRNSSSDAGFSVSLNGLASHSSEEGVIRPGCLPKPPYPYGSPQTSHPPPDPETGYRGHCFLRCQNPPGDQAQKEQQLLPEGADILRQMTLKFGPSLSSSSSSSPPLVPRSTPAVTTATSNNTNSSQASGSMPASVVAKDSPLDLTNKLKSLSPNNSHSPSSPLSMNMEAWAPSTAPGGQQTMKRNLPEGVAASSEENSCSGGDVQASSPRKRSRKGKAYKLEALCLKLQEKQTSSSPYQSDSNESDHADAQTNASVPASTPMPVSNNLGATVKEKISGQNSSTFREGLEDDNYPENVARGAAENPEVQTNASEYDGMRKNWRLLNSLEEQAEHLAVATLERFNLNKPPFSPPRQDASSSPPRLQSSSDCVSSSATTTAYHHVDTERGKTLLVPDMYHHRRKPVTPALRRGAEVAWKILQDPVNSTLQSEAKGDPSRSLSLPPVPPPSPKYGLGRVGGSSSPPLTRDGTGNGFSARAAPPQRLSTHAQTVQALPACMEEPRQKASPAVPVGESYECSYCDITFRESVMHAVHMGFHGYQDPFKCNMCGQVSKDKFEFFLHIARTAHN